MTGKLSLALAFALGACTTASIQLAAAPAAQPDPTTEAPPAAVAPKWVTPLVEAPRRAAPNKKGAITLLARGENAFVGKLELDAGGAVPTHRDVTEEYIHILQGGGEMTIEGQVYEVTTGSTIYMPAGVEVSFQNGPTKLVALQVFAGPEPAAKYDQWQPQ